MEINDKLRELRKLRKLTQSQVAEKLGMTQSNYAVWENSNIDIGINKCLQLAKIFEVSLFELLGLEQSVNVSDLAFQKLQEEVATMRQIIQDKDSLIKRLHNEEQRYINAVDKLVEAVYIVYENWYLDVAPNKMSLEEINRYDTKFWTQFFSIGGVRFALEAQLVHDAFFEEAFQRFKSNITKHTTPFESRKSNANDIWVAIYDLLQKKDVNTANKKLTELNMGLKEVGCRFIIYEEALPFSYPKDL